MTLLRIDYETRSEVDLKTAGLAVYARSPTTEAICMAWAFDEDPVACWEWGEPLPQRVREHIEAGGKVEGHNVGFEIAITNHVMAPRFGWPMLRPEQCEDTAAMAAAMNLPRDLGGVGHALQVPIKKDEEGKRLMLSMCKPKKRVTRGDRCPYCRGRGCIGPKKDKNLCEDCWGLGSAMTDYIVWVDDRASVDRLKQYCCVDVEAERVISKRLLKLRPFEERLWRLDWTINDRGVLIDQSVVSKALDIVRYASKELDTKMSMFTDGAVSSCTQSARIAAWITTQGVDADGVDKESVTDLLERDDLPDNVRYVLETRQEAAKSSTAKLVRMRQCVNEDGRVRGMFLFNGAGTGRWSGKLIQLHNMPRSTIKAKAIAQVLATVQNERVEYARDVFDTVLGPPLQRISDCLRGMLIAAPGKTFITADFSNIEGRVNAWLAGQDDLIEVFRNDGPVYEAMGAFIFGLTTDEVLAKGKDCLERTVGKQAVLGCGYGMGAPKFKDTCKKQANVKLSDELAEQAVVGYRSKNDRIVQFWRDAQAAAIAAVENPGAPFPICGGRVAYKMAGSFLWCRLPSGRALCYPYPTVKMEDVSYETTEEYVDEDGVTQTRKVTRTFKAKGVRFMGTDSTKGNKWLPQKLYGGLAVENIVQAVARDLLAEAMFRVEAAGYPVVLHVHDELVAEVPEGFGSLEEFEALMAETPDWAKGCPVAAEGWTGTRYRK